MHIITIIYTDLQRILLCYLIYFYKIINLVMIYKNFLFFKKKKKINIYIERRIIVIFITNFNYSFFFFN